MNSMSRHLLTISGGFDWNDSGERALLAHVFSRATGVDIEEYAVWHLFAPLGITQWFWKRTPMVVVLSAWHILTGAPSLPFRTMQERIIKAAK